jgi:uncharacterized protein YggL (DUF469 family)
VKRRLRKKKRLGEFADWCFELDAKFTPPLEEHQLDQLCDRMTEEVEAAGLTFGGGGNTCTWRSIVQFGERQPDEDDRLYFHGWFRRQPNVSSCNVGSIRDANYGWSD